MKVLHFGACVGIAVLAGFTFLLGAAIATKTKLSDVPEWSKVCTVHRLYGTAELLCDGYQSQTRIDDAAALAAMRPALIACKGYRTRGLFQTITVECEEPKPDADF